LTVIVLNFFFDIVCIENPSGKILNFVTIFQKSLFRLCHNSLVTLGKAQPVDEIIALG